MQFMHVTLREYFEKLSRIILHHEEVVEIICKHLENKIQLFLFISMTSSSQREILTTKSG